MARVTYPLRNGGKLVLNKKAFVELMKSGEMQRDLMRRARKVKAAAGEGFEESVFVGKNRARASVITGTYAARRKQSKDNILQRALYAGRG